jgi:uncharacterized protein (DUF362 family)
MEPITRRLFLKRAISGIGGVTLASTFGTNISLAQPDADMSRIVVVKHTEATDGVRNINAASVQVMMDESIKQLTGEATVGDAWVSLLPDFKEDHIVAIKVNGVNSMLPTHPVVVDAIVTGLTAAGVPENNIIVYDIVKWCLLQSGYKYNMTDVGVRYLATAKANYVDEDGWGADRDKPVDILGRKIFLSTILTRCDHLINVPVLKAHAIAVFTLSLKNHFGSLGSDPVLLHNNINLAIPTLNNQEAIKSKTRLIVIDALFGCWRGEISAADFVGNSLIVSRDPVAADYIGGEMINEERVRLNLRPVSMNFMLNNAAEMGLGTNDPENMELIRLELEPPEEEVEEKPEDDAGRSVDPTDSYRTQWGRIKTAH